MRQYFSLKLLLQSIAVIIIIIIVIIIILYCLLPCFHFKNRCFSTEWCYLHLIYNKEFYFGVSDPRAIRTNPPTVSIYSGWPRDYSSEKGLLEYYYSVFVQFCSVHYFMEFGFVWKTSKPPVQVTDLSGRIILKWILKKCDGKQWIGFICLKIRSSGGCCDFGDEIPPFIKCFKFLQFCSVLYFMEFGFVWKTSKPPVQVTYLSGRIILKWILKKCDGKQWIGFICLKIRSSGGCCEFGDEIPPFIKCFKFFTSRAAVSFSGNVLFRVVSEPHWELLPQMERIDFCRGWNIPKVILSPHVATTPREPEPESLRSLSDTPNFVGLLWLSDQTVSETSTWQHTHTQETGISIAEGIRIRNLSKQVAAYQSLRPRSYWDRLSKPYNRHTVYWKVEAMWFIPSQGQISYSSPQLSDAPNILPRVFTGSGFGHRMYLYILYPENKAWLCS